MNLSSSLDMWCFHIHKIETSSFHFKYDESCIYNFKHGKNTSDAYKRLKNELNNLELTKENMNAYLFQLFCKIPPTELGKISLTLMSRMMITRRLISVDATDDHVRRFNKIIDLVLEDQMKQYENMSTLSDSIEFNEQSQPIDMQDFDQFFRFLKRNLDKRFSSVTTMLDNRFDSRLESFIKETKENLKLNNEIESLFKIDCQSQLSFGDLTKKDSNDLYEMIRIRIVKILICKNEMKKLKLHTKQKTTPKQLFYSNFPYPFVKNDKKFIAAYDRLIGKAQIDIMDFIINYLDKECKLVLEKEIEELKAALRVLNFTEDDIYDTISLMYDNEAKNLKENFEKSLAKAAKIKNQTYSDMLKLKLKSKTSSDLVEALELSSDDEAPHEFKISINKKSSKVDKMSNQDTDLKLSSIIKIKNRQTRNTKQSGKKERPNRCQSSKSKSMNLKRNNATRVNEFNRNFRKYNSVSAKSFNFRSVSRTSGRTKTPPKSDRTSIVREFNRQVSALNENHLKAKNATLKPLNPSLLTINYSINDLIDNAINKRLNNPLKQNSLPKIKTTLSLDELANENFDNLVMSDTVLPLNEPSKFAHSPEYKEIVSKVMMLKNLTRSKSKCLNNNNNNYNKLLFNNNNESNSDLNRNEIIKVSIRGKSAPQCTPQTSPHQPDDSQFY